MGVFLRRRATDITKRFLSGQTENSSIDYRTRGRMSPASWILVWASIILRRETVAYDDAFLRLIVDSMNLLFPPIRVSAHLCRLQEGEEADRTKPWGCAMPACRRSRLITADLTRCAGAIGRECAALPTVNHLAGNLS